VLELLEQPQRSEFIKEEGERVVGGHRPSANELGAFSATLLAANLPIDDLAGAQRQFYRFTNTLYETVGLGGIEGVGPDRLIRSLVVLPERRGRNYGKAIAQTLERLAGRDGAERLHLLTTDAAPFFEQLGYQIRGRAEAPATIAMSEEFKGLCPASATYMTKTVKTSW